MPRSRIVFALGVMAVARAAVFAGAPPATTIITHGFSTDAKGAWVQAMAEAIITRAGEGSIYRYTGATGSWAYVPSAASDGTSGVLALIFNWVPESDAPAAGPNWNYAQAAGDALYAALRDPRFINLPSGVPPPAHDILSERAIHFIGHSRGACVTSEAILRLARENIAVDHSTALDAHPVNGTLDFPLNFNWNDPTPRRWSNTTFADAYWRADGGGFNAPDFDGIPIDGAFNTQLSESALNCCAYSLAHSDVHLWYHGTIDLDPPPGACDGEQCISAQMRQTWWPEGFAERGWFYSALGGGSAQRPTLPASFAPPAAAWIFNGDFANASHAGWSYHGGSVGGAIANEGGAQFLKLGAGAGSSPLASHNRFLLPHGASAIELDTRVILPAGPGGESLRISLVEAGGRTHVVVTDPIPVTAEPWITNRRFSIDPAIPHNRAYTLRFEIVSAGAESAQVGIDNIELVLIAGDANSDGCVNVDDLLAVITAWGDCAEALDCPADLDRSGAVNVDDLLVVITNWGGC